MIKCAICGKMFEDMGCHPLTCGSQACAKQANSLGLWNLSQANAIAYRRAIDNGSLTWPIKK